MFAVDPRFIGPDILCPSVYRGIYSNNGLSVSVSHDSINLALLFTVQISFSSRGPVNGGLLYLDSYWGSLEM